MYRGAVLYLIKKKKNSQGKVGNPKKKCRSEAFLLNGLIQAYTVLLLAEGRPEESGDST